MGSKDRPKASDIFKNTNYLFSNKVPFQEAFPNIEDLSIEVTEHEDFWKKEDEFGLYPRRTIYSIQRLPGEYHDCSNTSCYKGGFSIGEVLREMISNKETTKEDSSGCQGYEGSPKGRRRHRSCMHKFDYKIELTYKAE